MARSSFDQKLDMLLPLLADREEFKDAVLLFAQAGLTIEEIEQLAIDTVRERCGLPPLRSDDPEQHRFGRA
ncbi:hypothetical protein [Cryobacterium cryoconiti]|uniref:Uncharacterized protein n=1 Tax=Cryobacterium cryoconiti TaxID=1259239 RepID=A0A4Y8JWI0_9MICO|nr:hypothetical protein [Cryobacterium cryoconiti]TFD27499.1 hypothetical protein E3T49_13230 [Cryobacterium cryoconiti]